MWKGLNIKLQQFVTIFCWNIYHQTCRCLFCLFTFWEEKKCNPVFNPWLSLLFNPWSSQGIYLHHSNPIVLKIPCAKFHASSCCQTKVKVEGQFCPLSLFPSPLTSSPPSPHTHPKKKFKKPTRSRVTNMVIDKANLERLKVFCVQTLLRQYVPCEHSSIDDKIEEKNYFILEQYHPF